MFCVPIAYSNDYEAIVSTLKNLVLDVSVSAENLRLTPSFMLGQNPFRTQKGKVYKQQ